MNPNGKPDLSSQINHPQHYKRGGIEALDVIEAWELNFNIGNVVKYTCRAGYKSTEEVLTDLRKAQFYINREIQRLESSTNTTRTTDTRPASDSEGREPDSPRARG